jgi:site-specific DNA-methyltransferase (adenine-specific)
MEDDSVDAICIDPPAGIAFMGKAWDSDRGGRDAWIEWLSGIMAELLRVTKPGGHMLCWALPRTQHWTATAIENAGWDVRDVLMHVFGSGFPKSRNLPGGWGTALKPSHEAWILARKPLAGTVAANVLEHGTGALNIDGCRVGTTETLGRAKAGWGNKAVGANNYGNFNSIGVTKEGGRWPPHLLLTHAAACGETCADGCPVAEMDAQSGRLISGSRKAGEHEPVGYMGSKPGAMPEINGDTGGASRFFPVFRYVAKPSTAEKSAGLHGRNEHATVKSIELMRWLVRLITPPGGLVLDCFMGSGTTGIAAVLEGARFVGIEQRPAMVEVARKRIAHWETGAEIDAPEAPKAGDEPAGPRQMGLFG